MSQYQELGVYINGEFRTACSNRVEKEVINPADESVLAYLPCVGQAELDEALHAAHVAFKKWKKTPALERSAILRKAGQLIRERAEDIARHITLDQGKPYAEAYAEVFSSADQAEWHAEECRRIYGRIIPPRNIDVRQMVVREPVGVCVAFTPWNFPFSQAIKKMVAAIGAGCTLILKGPEESPSAIVALAKVFHDAGLPKGVLNIVWGEPAQISSYLISSPLVSKVAFTGSVPVGKQLASLAGQHMKRMSMELGGHSPVIVFDDVDVAEVATMLARFKMRNAGQVCVSPSRFYVHERIQKQFTEVFADVMKNSKIGFGLDKDVTMGPMANARRVMAMEELVADACNNGAKVLTGGARVEAYSKGYYFAPTVVVDLPETSKLLTEEPFGPIAPIVPFSDVDSVIERANALPFGLASYVFTGAIKTAHYVSRELEAGMVNINHFNMGSPEIPFGGIKDSGMGSEGGTETFDSYLSTKYITEI
ncbi:MAG: NAD-dependent succinate-semialdehyde dehydrogenase [Alcaligenaceae bacterium]|nr:NAD-dependent succinate-semialdehyde dehydrogenase [Alcaligenaceae bacterium]